MRVVCRKIVTCRTTYRNRTMICPLGSLPHDPSTSYSHRMTPYQGKKKVNRGKQEENSHR